MPAKSATAPASTCSDGLWYASIARRCCSVIVMRTVALSVSATVAEVMVVPPALPLRTDIFERCTVDAGVASIVSLNVMVSIPRRKSIDAVTNVGGAVSAVAVTVFPCAADIRLPEVSSTAPAPMSSTSGPLDCDRFVDEMSMARVSPSALVESDAPERLTAAEACCEASRIPRPARFTLDAGVTSTVSLNVTFSAVPVNVALTNVGACLSGTTCTESPDAADIWLPTRSETAPDATLSVSDLPSAMIFCRCCSVRSTTIVSPSERRWLSAESVTDPPVACIDIFEVSAVLARTNSSSSMRSVPAPRSKAEPVTAGAAVSDTTDSAYRPDCPLVRALWAA